MQKRPLQDIVSKKAKPRRVANSSVRPTEPAVSPDAIYDEEPVLKPRRPAPAKSSREVRIGKRKPVDSDIPPRRPISISGLPNRPKPPKNGAWLVLAAVIGISILGLAFLMSVLFSGATVTVFPKQQNDVFIDGTFIAKKEPLVGELGYNIMTIERTLSETVDATKQENAEEYATGEIVVFNEFDDNPQRLIKNTRFESPDGKIYRIRESVTVPGLSTDANGKNVPGQIEVTVYADEPGEEYNVGITEFTIPGFEGTARFDKFKVRSKTPIAGGFKGSRLALADEIEIAARERLRDQLVEELKAAAFSPDEKPEGFYLYEDAVFIDFEELPSTESSDTKAEIREKGILNAVLLNEDEFAKHLAANTIAGYDDSEVLLQNPEELAIKVERLSSDELPWDGDTYRVVVSGTADFIWKYDEEQLKTDLAGRDEESWRNILTSAYRPSIEKAEVVMRPFWRSTFPEDVEDITVVQVLD